MAGERLALAKEAIGNLLGSTSVSITAVMAVSFSSDGYVHQGQAGPWVSAEEANSYFQGVSATGGTNYSGAISNVMSEWGAPPSGADKTLVYFISDGEPTFGQGLDGTQTAAWETFLSEHGVNTSYAIGISTNVDDADLAPIAWSATDANFLPIVLDSATGLDDTLQGTVVTTHNIFSNTTVGFGADGGRIESVTVDGVTYTWDGASTITASGTNNATLSATSIMVATALGGELTFYLGTAQGHAAGDWTYKPPASLSGAADEVFHYVLVDNDGDHAGADITVALTADGYAPSVDLNGESAGANYAASVFNDDHAVAVFGASPSIVDADSAHLQSALVSASLAGHQYYETYGADQLGIDTQALGGATGNASSGSWEGLSWQYSSSQTHIFLTITGEASLSTYEQLLAAVRFATNSDNGADRIFELTVNDGTHDSVQVTSTVSVHVDEAPAFSTAGLVAVSQGIQALVTGLAVLDGDAGTDPMAFSVSTQDGTLGFFGSTDGVSVGGNGTGTLTGTGTLSAIDAALTNGIVYTAQQSQPAIETATATIDDGHGKSDALNFIFAVGYGVNDPVSLTGTTGKDVIFSAGPDATLTGNGGSDTFVFAVDNGAAAHIADFNTADDFLQISHTIFDSVDAVLAAAAQGTGNTVISTAAQGSLVLDGVDNVTFQSIDHSHIIIV